MELPCITNSVSYEPEIVHLQLEEIRQDIQDIQDASYNYLVNMHRPNTYLMGTACETINYITQLFQEHHYYPRLPSTPIIQIYYPIDPEHLPPDHSEKEPTADSTAASTAASNTKSTPLASGTAYMTTITVNTSSVPIANGPLSMSTLFFEAPLLDTQKEP